MAYIVLPILLMASGIAANNDAAPATARAQAVASATIISGEAVSFEQAGFRLASQKKDVEAATYKLPLAHSATGNLKKGTEEISLIEFY